YLLRSDEWRTWAQNWTIAPLYYPFEALVFFLFGAHLGALRLVQCVLGAVAAVAVGALGREAAGPRGWLAGLGYAFYAYSIELPCWTLTENLHNALLAVAAALLLRSVTRRSLRLTVAGGAVLGVSALARSVSSAFLPPVARRFRGEGTVELLALLPPGRPAQPAHGRAGFRAVAARSVRRAGRRADRPRPSLLRRLPRRRAARRSLGVHHALERVLPVL